jgi:hypothetical protein
MCKIFFVILSMRWCATFAAKKFLVKASNVYHAFVNFIEHVWSLILHIIIGIVLAVKIIGRLWCAITVAVSKGKKRSYKNGT